MLNLTLPDPHNSYEEIVFRDSNEENLNDNVHANCCNFSFTTKRALILTLIDPHDHKTSHKRQRGCVKRKLIFAHGGI